MQRGWLERILRGLSARITTVSGSGEHILLGGEHEAVVCSSSFGEEELIEKLKLASLWGQRERSGERSERAYWESLGVAARPLAVRVGVVGDLAEAWVEKWLQSVGIMKDEEASTAVLLTDDYLRPGLREALAAAHGLKVLLAKPVGTEIWVGPWLRADMAGRYEELAYWLRAQRANRALVSGWTYPPAISVASTDWTSALAMGWIGSVLAKGQEEPGEDKDCDGAFVSFDCRHLQQGRHVFLQTARKSSNDWISPHTGLVSRIVVERFAFGLHHAMVEFRLPPLQGSLHRPSNEGFAYGSGLSREEARDKAVFESIERFSTHFDGEEDLVDAFYDPDRCIHPNDIMQFSAQQYASGDPEVPAAFSPEGEIRWMVAQAEGEYEDKLVPAALALMDYSDDSQPGMAVTSSSGCAAGPSLAKAMHSAKMELIERDAVGVWWYRRAHCPGWDWRSEGCELSHRIAKSLVEAGRSLEVLDLSSDWGIHVCVALSAHDSGDEPVFGAGAGMSLQEACRSACRELSQVLNWRAFWKVSEPYGYETVADFMRGVGQRKQRLPQAAPLKSYSVNLSRRRIGIPVVRAVIPGLQPHGRQLGSARLWELAERLGWETEVRGPNEIHASVCPL